MQNTKTRNRTQRNEIQSRRIKNRRMMDALKRAAETPSRNTFNELVRKLTPIAEAFRTAAADSLKTKIARKWQKDPKVNKALNAWARDVVSWLDANMRGNGATGHDKRHLAKDLAAGLGYNPYNDPVLHLCAIPSLLHDTGRLIEALFKGIIPYGESAPQHALFSFAIASQFACKPYFQDIPKVISDHILHAILEHTKAAKTPDMLHLVCSADRQQLVGPEAVARLAAVQTAFGLPILLKEREHRSLNPKDMIGEGYDALHAVEFYLRYLYPQYNPLAQKIADGLKVDSAVFLLLALPEDHQRQVFAPELRCSASGEWTGIEGEKRIIPRGIWDEANRIVSEMSPHDSSITPEETLNRITDFMYRAPGTAAHEGDVKAFKKRFEELPVNIQQRLGRAYEYLRGRRERYDEADRAMLAFSNARPNYINTMAHWAKKQLSQA